jgi:hypothetical protein
VTPQVTVLEEISWVSPLGMRFWDVAAAAPSEAGLSVTAYPDAYPELVTPSVWNGSGVYSFSALPGLRRAENGAGDTAYWSANPPAVPYTVQVSDPQGRYLPFQFSLLLPWFGLYGLAGSPLLAAPVPDATWIPVFSAPARPAGGVAGMIRAVLEDPTGAPAAWAVVTAQATGGALAVGVADVRGVISLPLPYPELPAAGVLSPLGSTPVKLSDQTWPLEIGVYWTPAVGEPAAAPDLEELLQQAAANVWSDTTLTVRATTFTLGFGNDLILRSVDQTSGRELPYLLVTAAGSPL